MEGSTLDHLRLVVRRGDAPNLFPGQQLFTFEARSSEGIENPRTRQERTRKMEGPSEFRTDVYQGGPSRELASVPDDSGRQERAKVVLLEKILENLSWLKIDSQRCQG
ncbi:hypothetical protein M407DRAFT_34751 [Tulasnella calospora MUT 4182]|uniref:Uncharacterized protein n=1 Tax=Tulasnella calospora MUT 4182 TaxID=1051891 RepID=A0A0C3Q051_9AGAM|nr:hypothetical protein M407DRAFT_34751 [Tulasnella calospora MUT 4182]